MGARTPTPALAGSWNTPLEDKEVDTNRGEYQADSKPCFASGTALWAVPSYSHQEEKEEHNCDHRENQQHWRESLQTPRVAASPSHLCIPGRISCGNWGAKRESNIQIGNPGSEFTICQTYQSQVHVTHDFLTKYCSRPTMCGASPPGPNVDVCCWGIRAPARSHSTVCKAPQVVQKKSASTRQHL